MRHLTLLFLFCTLFLFSSSTAILALQRLSTTLADAGVSEAEAVIEHSGYLYVASKTTDNKVACVQTSDMTLKSTVTAPSGASRFVAAAKWIDPATSIPYGLFSTVAAASAGSVWKMSLLCSTSSSAFSSTSFAAGASDSLYAGVVLSSTTTTTNRAIFLTFSVPGRLLEFHVGNMSSSGRSVSGDSGENYFRSAALLSDDSFLLVGTATSPGILIKFSVAGGLFDQAMTRIGAISGSASSNENTFISIVMMSNTDAFVTCFGAPRIVKFSVGGATDAPARVSVAIGSLTQNTAEFFAAVAVPSQGAVYVVSSQASPGRVFQLNTAAMVFVASADGSSTDESNFRNVLVGSDTKLYVTTGQSPSRVLVFDITSTPAPPPAPVGVGPATTVALTPSPLSGGGGGSSGYYSSAFSVGGKVVFCVIVVLLFLYSS